MCFSGSSQSTVTLVGALGQVFGGGSGCWLVLTCRPVGQGIGSICSFCLCLELPSEEMAGNKRIHEEQTGAVMARINTAELPTVGGVFASSLLSLGGEQK